MRGRPDAHALRRLAIRGLEAISFGVPFRMAEKQHLHQAMHDFDAWPDAVVDKVRERAGRRAKVASEPRQGK